jgi:hypothetical protein
MRISPRARNMQYWEVVMMFGPNRRAGVTLFLTCVPCQVMCATELVDFQIWDRSSLELLVRFSSTNASIPAAARAERRALPSNAAWLGRASRFARAVRWERTLAKTPARQSSSFTRSVVPLPWDWRAAQFGTSLWRQASDTSASDVNISSSMLGQNTRRPLLEKSAMMRSSILRPSSNP